MNDPFLIDECLSPELVAIAQDRGHYATHIVYRNLQGSADRELIPLIQEEGFVVVTNNGRDFLKLLGREPLHPGLIVIVHADKGADDQLRLFGLALDAVESLPELINKVVEVFSDGAVTIRDWPSGG